ncbi:hypothetical protein I7G60_31225 [Sinorhizobium meliloti]|uniref:hypothetical protein n=1 Tax=Rhizobium meliloti TaxID=382 RepID=UPI0002D6EDE5|nr:hypothetical protein [Sinorhizobium meliloti]
MCRHHFIAISWATGAGGLSHRRVKRRYVAIPQSRTKASCHIGGIDVPVVDAMDTA